MKPFPPPPGHKVAEYDPRITDEEMQTLFEMYLRPEQRSNEVILRFILSYCECRNTAQAGREAGLKNANYWRSRPEIHACIDAITAKAVMKYGYDASEVVERAKEIASIDPIDFQNPDGSFKTHMSEIRPEARRAIKKFKAKNIYGQDANGMAIVIGQLVEVELWDKLKALDQLATEKNIFKKTTVVEHDVTANMASVLLESGRRADARAQALLAQRDVTPGGDDGTRGTESSSDNESGRNSEDVQVAE